MLKELAKSALSVFGLKISRTPTFGADPIEDAARSIQRPDPVCFDVGANDGRTAIKMKRLFPNPLIHCFEPSPVVFERLKLATSGFSGVVLNQLGVGAEAGEMVLQENTNCDMSSFLEMKDGWGSVHRSTKVQVTTIDDYCSNSRIKRIDVLSIDTQGFDYQVLLGAERMLREHLASFVIFEMTIDPIYEGVERVDRVIGHMLDRDYVMCGVYGQCWREGRLSWADLMFRSRLLYPISPLPR